MRIERSRVKIIISKSDYEKLNDAKDVIKEMKEELYNENGDELDFYKTLTYIEDYLEELTYGFDSTRNDEYVTEVE